MVQHIIRLDDDGGGESLRDVDVFHAVASRSHVGKPDHSGSASVGVQTEDQGPEFAIYGGGIGATAAGALYSDAAAKFAVLAKTTRNAMIVFVVFGYAIYWARKSKRPDIANQGSFPVAEIPHICPGLPGDFDSLDPRRLF